MVVSGVGSGGVIMARARWVGISAGDLPRLVGGWW